MAKLFKVTGTIGRGTWWLSLVLHLTSLAIAIIAIPGAMALSYAGAGWLGAILLLLLVPALVLSLWLAIVPTITRLRDLDITAWAILLWFVPPFSLVLVVLCGFVAGRTSRDFSDEPFPHRQLRAA